MPLALLAVAVLALAACGETTSTYTPTTVDPVDYQQQELDAAIEESLESVDTSELAILEET